MQIERAVRRLTRWFGELDQGWSEGIKLWLDSAHMFCRKNLFTEKMGSKREKRVEDDSKDFDLST